MHNCKSPKDLVDGACEPFALYLSTSILSSIVDGSFVDVMQSNEIKDDFERIGTTESRKNSFEKFINNASTFLIWDPQYQCIQTFSEMK